MTEITLFRREVLENRASRAYGNILIIRPVSFFAWTSIACGVLAALVILLFIGRYAERVTVSGVTTSEKGLNRILSPQRGIIVERPVNEGDYVHAGDVLFILSSERYIEERAGAQARILSKMRDRRGSLVQDIVRQQLIFDAQRTAALAKVRQQELLVDKVHEQLETQRQRVLSTQKQLKQYVDLEKEGFYGSVLLQQRRDEVLEQQMKEQSLSVTMNVAEADLANFRYEHEVSSTRLLRDIAAVKREIAQLDQELALSEATQKVYITAPQNGLVTSVLASVGQMVNDQPLLTLLPEGSRYLAVLYVPSRAIGFVAAGNKVKLRFAPYPYQKFGQVDGLVKEVSRSSLQTSDLPEQFRASALQSGDGFYQVIVTLDKQAILARGRTLPLSVDMKVEADILQDERRLIEWAFEPLLTLRERL